jgi:hypothetical protein
MRRLLILLVTAAALSLPGFLLIQFGILSSVYCAYLYMVFVPGYWIAALVSGDGASAYFWAELAILHILYAALILFVWVRGPKSFLNLRPK